MSSLFGNTQSGSVPSTTLGGSSLFGSTINTNQPAATQTGGLFGAKPQATPSAFGSLLGGNTINTNTTQQSALGGTSKPSLSLFGASTAPAAQPALGTNTLASSLFNTTTTANPQTTAAGQTQQQAPVQSTTGAYFDSLLARNKKLAEGETALGELPSLQLGLGDLRQRLRQLGPRSHDSAASGKAHYFLAASGVDPGAAVKDLGAFGLTSRAERPPAWATSEVDVDTYLSNLQTKTTLSMIADGLERSVRDFDNFLEDNVTMEWEAQRKRVYQHFGIKPREEKTDRASSATPAARETQGGFGRSSRRKSTQVPAGQRPTQRASTLGRSVMQRSVIGTPSRIGAHSSEFSDVESSKEAAGSLNGGGSMDDRFLREKQGKLADTIHALNDARQHNEPFFICSEFAEIESKSGDRHGPHIVEAYRAVMEMVGESPELGEAPRERQFAQQYLDPDTQSQNAVAMKNRILKGANRFLEKQFWNELNTNIGKYSEEAQLGGRPDVVSKVQAYIRLRVARKSLVNDGVDLQQANGDYIWAVVFYLLRAGFVNEAAQYVNNNQNHFRAIDRTFSGYINSYASSEDRKLKRQMQDRCAGEYNQRVRNAPESSIDPYRMACYKIIGRCDLSNRSLEGFTNDVNDWVWLQFNLAREADRVVDFAGDNYGLNELQASIREIGLKHFPKTPAEDTNGSFGMFFYLQILSGMFEQAIAYLYPFSYVDAAHFGIALTYYGLLRPTPDAHAAGNELLSHNTRDQPQINFGRMLGYYTRDFRAANAAAAVDYLVLICLNADVATGGDNQQAALCHEALRELVLETREFSKLIGDIKPDGHRIKGVIEERGSLISLAQERDFIRAITLQAASFADDNGRTTDAVLLYHLAGDYDTVVSIVSRALSEAISLEIGEDPMRLVPVKPRDSDASAQPGSSLSLAAIDDPVELAKTMMTMYERDHMFWQRIRDPNRVACSVLLQMSDIKGLVEQGKWPQCLDKIKALEILPLGARGDPSVIRNYAAKFASLAQPVAINVPNLLMWTIVCCTKQRERLVTGQFSGNESTARLMVDELKQMSVDLTTYTSQLRYRLPPHLHEALARASAD
ncbi:putative nuclear pore protein [Cercophora scortea]|uniref:Nuclear pore protein n=1 Tax=Cercophora scortea TaxID=314031 RepID=A0AAE0M6R0_9PEZI|nr:putative nuclear pore protein [Cercophora scortea]